MGLDPRMIVQVHIWRTFSPDSSPGGQRITLRLETRSDGEQPHGARWQPRHGIDSDAVGPAGYASRRPRFLPETRAEVPGRTGHRHCS